MKYLVEEYLELRDEAYIDHVIKGDYVAFAVFDYSGDPQAELYTKDEIAEMVWKMKEKRG